MKVRVSTPSRLVAGTTANGLPVSNQDKARFVIRIRVDTLVNGKLVSNMDMAHTLIRMVIVIVVVGSTINDRVQELISTQVIRRVSRENGKKASVQMVNGRFMTRHHSRRRL